MRIISTSYFLTVILSIVHVGFVHSEGEYTLDVLKVVVVYEESSEGNDDFLLSYNNGDEAVHNATSEKDGETVAYTEKLYIETDRNKFTRVLDFKTDVLKDKTNRSFFAVRWTAKTSSNMLRAESTNTAISAKACYANSALYQILIALKEFPSAIPRASNDFEVEFLEATKAMMTQDEESENVKSDLVNLLEETLARKLQNLKTHDFSKLFTRSISVWIPSMEFFLCEVELAADFTVECMMVTNGEMTKLAEDVAWSLDSRFVILVVKLNTKGEYVDKYSTFKRAHSEFWKDHVDGWATMTTVSAGSVFKSQDKEAIEQFFRNIQHFWHLDSNQLTDELDLSPNRDPKATKSRISKLMSYFFGSREAT